MILEKCNEACGYAAAFLSAICLGSFGVPVKSKVVSRLDVDPLVMQTYKTAMCFLTCWLIIPMGEQFRFTSWGIVSGLFWVPGGWAGIYGIRTAGLAIAVGTWSPVIVLTSFFWGIIIFEEHVKSKLGTCCACLTLIFGLVGMSIFSRPQIFVKGAEKSLEDEKVRQKKRRVSSAFGDEEDNDGTMRKRKENMSRKMGSTNDLKTAISEKGTPSKDENATKKRSGAKTIPKDKKVKTEVVKKTKAPSSLPLTSLEMESLIENNPSQIPPTPENKRISFFGRRIILTKRQTGILASLFNGLWGGTNMIPLHFAAYSGYGGPSYVISFACGSMIITIALWILRFVYELYRLDGAIAKAYHALPSFYVMQIGFQGCLSGILYSAGNFAAIISVTYLGQGVGYSFTQASMLISGLWGIFLYKEVEGRDRIINWLLSACIAVTGILWLSYEHAS